MVYFFYPPLLLLSSLLQCFFPEKLFFLWPNPMNRPIQPATLQNWCLKRSGKGACFPSPVSLDGNYSNWTRPKSPWMKNYRYSIVFFNVPCQCNQKSTTQGIYLFSPDKFTEFLTPYLNFNYLNMNLNSLDMLPTHRWHVSLLFFMTLHILDAYFMLIVEILTP